ncbi:MAG TPA: methylglyoxal synthase, partial [Lysobacter sp.]|nr:methylglyoxal synthase [Lysobacter sp.]
KRQCVIHGKPFLSTVAAACDWMEMERIHAGLAPDPGADRYYALEQQTVALIAHDAMKAHMQAFVDGHFDVLSRYAHRVATGTTGQLLNELAWSRGWPPDTPWAKRYRSGPMGGDAQIADRVLEGRCQRVIFFEDPHVARQHEADIQLLERAVTTVTDDVVCFTSPTVAARWVAAVRRRAQRRS